MNDTFEIPVTESDSQPEVNDDLVDLYRGFEREYLIPLWTEIGDLMPREPRSKARPHLWRWADLVPLAARSGELVPVGRGAGSEQQGEQSGCGASGHGGLLVWRLSKRLASRKT